LETPADITAHLQSLNKALYVRQKKLLTGAFFLAIFFHVLFVGVTAKLGKVLFSGTVISGDRVFLIQPTSYVEYKSTGVSDDASPIAMPAVKEPENPAKISKGAKENIIINEKPLPYPRYNNTRPDTSWRDSVSKALPDRKAGVPQKITVSKMEQQTGKAGGASGTGAGGAGSGSAAAKGTAPSYAGKSGGLGGPAMSYLGMLINIFRNNWSLPEDLGHKFYNLSCEIEVSVDAGGNIKKTEVARSSGNSVFDFYAKDAAMKTKKIPLPPKEIFESLFLSDKITLEFKP
jgi:TonB family protein